MNKDKAREAFEAHASQNGKFPAVVHRGEDGEYTNPFTHSTHRAWTAALQWAASQPQDSKAWAVLGEDGDVSMVFLDRDEALTYCGEGEQPVALVFGGAASQQAAEGWRPMESVPKEPGRYIYVQQQAVYRWLPYKANSQEFKRGKKGRWQKHTGFGFDNAELEGQGWRDADESAPPSTQGGAE